MSLSNYLENALINAVLRGAAYTSPATVYVSLHTADPAETGANEVSGNAYARQAITFGAPTNGVSVNTNTITFPTATPSAWGTITHLAIWDASTAGNCLFEGELTASKVVGAGDTFKFDPSAVTCTLA